MKVFWGSGVGSGGAVARHVVLTVFYMYFCII